MENHLPSTEEGSERGPLPTGVHQRPEGELHELLGPWITRRQERLQSQRRLLHHRASDVLGTLDGGAARVPAAEDGEEDVLLAPHDSLGQARRPSGVEDVAVVGGTSAAMAL